MRSFDELSRNNFHPDALAKAAEQEAAERETAAQEPAEQVAAGPEPMPHLSLEALGRANFRPDALAKAAEQEAFEQAEEERVARRRAARAAVQDVAASANATQGDQVEQAMPSRPKGQDASVVGGGAVVSRRGRLSAFMQGLKNRTPRKRNVSSTPPKSQRRRPTRRTESQWRAPSFLTGFFASGRFGALKVLLLVVGLVAALYMVFCLPIDRAISLTKEERTGLSSELSSHIPGTPYYVLALGSDARDGEEVSRTDTMILIRVEPLSGKITMLSIPRDTMVEIEGHGTQKINAAYAFGGTAGAVRAVHELTGAPISQVALIRFDGVESLVDYLGGVTVDVPVPVNDWSYTGLVLPSGEQEMDGHTALLFSRVRHGFTLGDYQRQKDQRILIEAILKKILSLPVTEYPAVVKNMGGLVGTAMRMYSILPLMARLKLAGGATVYQATLPSTTDTIDGVSYVIADEEALAQMMDAINAGRDPSALL